MAGRASPFSAETQQGASRASQQSSHALQEVVRAGAGSTGGAKQQSPAKTVAGALKKLFRLSSDKGADMPAPTGGISAGGSPKHSPAPSALVIPQQQQQQHSAGSSPTSQPSSSRPLIDHPKPASFKNAPSLEPTSVLDYDDRFSAVTDRSTLTDRPSVITSSERASAVTRDSRGTPASTGGTALSRANSRSSGSSRLGSYIRSIIKSGSMTAGTQPPAPAAGAGAVPAQPAAQQRPSSPPQQPQPQHYEPSPFQSSQQPPQGSIVLGAAGGTPAIIASSGTAGSAPTRGPFKNMPPGSNPAQQAGPPSTLSSSPRGLYDNSLVLPPPSASALARMQRDPNLLTVCNDLPPSMDRPSWRVEDYTLLQKIHAGYASAVYKAYCRHSGHTVALKVYQPAKLHEISQYQLYREARLHTQMNHPNIIKLYAAFRHGESVVLVQEFADGGDLLQLLMQHGTRLSERRATQLVLQPLLRALYYLHSRFIVHRDVKLENILFTGREMTLKVADFGLCLNLREERSVTRAGTLDYMAPEVLRCPQKHKPQDNKDRLDLAYDMTVDVWALGVVAYELLNGCPPFTCHDKKETEKRITSGLMPEFVVDVSDAAREFVYSCLARHSEQRPTAWQLLRNPWLKSGTRSSQPALMESLHAHRMAAAARAAGGTPSPMDSMADVHLAGEQVHEAAGRRAAAPTPAPHAAAAPQPRASGSASHLPGSLAAASTGAHENTAAPAAAAAGAHGNVAAGGRISSAPQPLLMEQVSVGSVAPPSRAHTPGSAGGNRPAVNVAQLLSATAQTVLTPANYTPGRVAAAYAQMQSAATAYTDAAPGYTSSNSSSVPTSPTAAGKPSSPTHRTSLPKNNQALVPTSQLLQQAQAQVQVPQPAPGNRFPAPYTAGSAPRIHVRTSAPAASALKALQTGMATPPSPSTPDTAHGVTGPPAGLSPIFTSPKGSGALGMYSEDSPISPSTPSAVAALAASSHGPFSLPLPDDYTAGQPLPEGVQHSQLSALISNLAKAGALPRVPPYLTAPPAQAGQHAAAYGGLPAHPAMASLSRRSVEQPHVLSSSSLSLPAGMVGYSGSGGMLRDALLAKCLPPQCSSGPQPTGGSLIAACYHPGADEQHAVYQRTLT